MFENEIMEVLSLNSTAYALSKRVFPRREGPFRGGLTVTDEILFPFFVNLAFEFAQVVLTMNQLSELMDIIWRVAVQHILTVFREVE